MRSIRWYIQRLRAMSCSEALWRARGWVRNLTDRLLLARRQRPRPLSAIIESGEQCADGPVLTDMRLGEWAGISSDRPEHAWRQRLLAKARRAAEHRLTFLNLNDCYLGDPIDWNCDHASGTPTPMRFAPSIDYREANLAGDCKLVWELNRHHHLVVLGRAYRASGDARYAAAAVEQLDSWLRQNPYGVGMNWRSPLELAIRLINWVWAADLLRDSGLLEGSFGRRLLDAVHRHVWEVDRNYSRGSSANNHVIGEAAGVFVAACYFPLLKGADRWRDRSRRLLLRQLLEQTYPDGGSREQAFGYHLFTLQLFTVAGVIARKTRRDFGPQYWSRLERMFEFTAALCEGGEQPPMFGDSDDGYVLDLGQSPRDVGAWLGVGAALYGRGDLGAGLADSAEPARWLLGRRGQQRLKALAATSPTPLACRAFEKTGYYLLQCGSSDRPDRISVVFDAGPHGFRSIAAHAHADALSFVLRAFGRDVLVDPGTYDYFSYPRWRDYFRSSRAHNTIVIDGLDQSVMQGPFLWGRRARARCLSWKPTAAGGAVTAEHDGYTRLDDPVTHRRTLALDGRGRRLVIRDDIIARREHEVAVYFHLAEHCRLLRLGPSEFEIDAGPGTVNIVTDPRLMIEVLTGSEQPIAGWVSRGYHRKSASTALIGRCRTDRSVTLTCRIDIALPRPLGRPQPDEAASWSSRGH